MEEKNKVIQLLNDIKVSQKLSFCSELFLFQNTSESDQQKKQLHILKGDFLHIKYFWSKVLLAYYWS